MLHTCIFIIANTLGRKYKCFWKLPTYDYTSNFLLRLYCKHFYLIVLKILSLSFWYCWLWTWETSSFHHRGLLIRRWIAEGSGVGPTITGRRRRQVLLRVLSLFEALASTVHGQPTVHNLIVFIVDSVGFNLVVCVWRLDLHELASASGIHAVQYS